MFQWCNKIINGCFFIEVLANVPISAASERMRNEIEMESKIRKWKEIDEEIIDCDTIRIRV